MFKLLFKSGIINTLCYTNQRDESHVLQGIIRQKHRKIIFINYIKLKFFLNKFTLILKYLINKNLNILMIENIQKNENLLKKFSNLFNFAHLNIQLPPSFYTNFKMYKKTIMPLKQTNLQDFNNPIFEHLQLLENYNNLTKKKIYKKKIKIKSKILQLKKNFDIFLFFSNQNISNKIQILNLNILTLTLFDIKNTPKYDYYFLPINILNFKSLFIFLFLLEYNLKKEILLKNLYLN